MELNTYQDAARTFAIYPRHNAQLYTLFGLASEVGEVTGKVAKALRGDLNVTNVWEDERFRVALVHELGDCLWFLAMVADEFGMDLNDIAVANLDKLLKRKQNGTIKGDGDNR